MTTVKEKLAYLRGLIEGSDFWGQESQTRAVWEKMLEIFDDVANHLEELEAGQEELEEYLEAIDNDLGELEEEMYGHEHDHDDDDEDYDDEDYDEDDEDDEAYFVEMECPNCKKTVHFDEDFLYDEDENGVGLTCPECGAVVYKSGSADDEAEASS